MHAESTNIVDLRVHNCLVDCRQFEKCCAFALDYKVGLLTVIASESVHHRIIIPPIK